MESLSNNRLQACEAQIQELRQTVSGLEHLLSRFLSGESERLMSLSRILQSSQFDPEMAVGAPQKEIVADVLHRSQPEPRLHSAAEDKTRELSHKVENFKWETERWQESVTSRMSFLEERMNSLLQGESVANRPRQTPTYDAITDQSTADILEVPQTPDTGLPSKIRKPVESANTIMTPDLVNTLNQAHLDIEKGFYKLHESVYDCGLIVFSKLVYLEDSFFIMFGILASIAIQNTMLILLTAIAKEDPDILIQGSTWWRREHAHSLDNLVVSQNVSLANSVCFGDWANSKGSQHVAMLGWIKTYLKPSFGFPIPQGLSMIMIVLVLWIAEALQEILACFKMTFGIFSIPCGWTGQVHSRLANLSEEGYRIKVVYLGGWRVFFLIFLCFGRFMTACWLCYIGCHWLAQTVRLEELLLNAISLSFIVDVDELMFHTLASQEVKWMIENMAPLGSPWFLAGRNRGKHMILPASMFAMGLGVWLYFMFADVFPYLDNMRTAEELYCGGWKDFVTWRNESTGLNHLRVTNGWPKLVHMHPLDVAKDPNTVWEWP